MKTLINRIEIENAIAAGYIQLPNGSYAHPKGIKAAAARARARAAIKATHDANCEALRKIAAQDAARAAQPQPVILSTATVIVTFEPDAAKGTVLVTTKRTGTWTPDQAAPYSRLTLPIVAARLEYNRLLRDGYLPW